MSKLRFHVKWEDPGTARGPELRATWARLNITVEDTSLTQAEDTDSGKVRNEICRPLYPIAEWMACNWWSLLNEVYSPKRPGARHYDSRHNLMAASEGYASPNLRIQPEGRRVLLKWQQTALPSCRLRFLNSGSADLDALEVAEELRQFIGQVVSRLETRGLHKSFLSEEWGAIEGADQEEKDFCAAAGRLGLDPYALDDEDLSETIIRLFDLLQPETAEEFFFAADSTHLKAQGKKLLDFVHEARAEQVNAAELVALRKQLGNGDGLRAPGTVLPWDQGYAVARNLREVLGAPPDRTFPTVSELGAAFNVDHETWTQSVRESGEKWRFLDAAVATTRGGSPVVSLEPRGYEVNKVFACCRVLFEYLTGMEVGTAGLATPAYSVRQKRNRAFAAEFIAPAKRLAGMVEGPSVTCDELQDLAAEFGTSDMVIRHQLSNHHIARIEDWAE